MNGRVVHCMLCVSLSTGSVTYPCKDLRILYNTHFLGDAFSFCVIVIDDETLCVCVIQMLAYERTIWYVIIRVDKRNWCGAVRCIRRTTLMCERGVCCSVVVVVPLYITLDWSDLMDALAKPSRDNTVGESRSSRQTRTTKPAGVQSDRKSLHHKPMSQQTIYQLNLNIYGIP